VVERLLEDERVPMTTAEQNKIIEEVLDEVLGLGPLEPLLKEASISDILVTGSTRCYIERAGKLSLTPVRFKDNAHLLHIIEKIVSQGRPPHRRSAAHCRRAVARRFARERDHSARLPSTALRSPSAVSAGT